ncbi:MAG: Holliday junction resolvase RuvX [Candidatus Pacebacteria bacterium]|jgi:putative transcription antitermination factor YqgF|nr:Holliday junction resolvase RuvX [Candidatus Paceibacterota bacterium]MBT3511542.1 Holliday junction resolvase RuvX [Candidatus Paceibacterota bacterium]MBT4004988.1 Holliday junction resolvase RuvX [Candidatus Paceibacterota bacterium]MBT4358764.1 Holliday junction resolvase RuvX [Candidatus Paceibacterota bacterium]MBT4680572.1 Holliday junction resolvase RuvX [Candidatus Paceibacterota bacterium]
MKKILAIDFGTKRIGLAVSRHSLAEPLKIIDNNELMFEKLKQVLEREEIDLILVGMSENEMAKKIKEFTKELKKTTALPIEFADETLSSKNIHQKLATSHMKLKKRQGPIDHYAAAEFLREWMDENL